MMLCMNEYPDVSVDSEFHFRLEFNKQIVGLLFCVLHRGSVCMRLCKQCYSTFLCGHC